MQVPADSAASSAAAGPWDALEIPARPGVALFLDNNGKAQLIAASADARALVRRRFGLEASAVPSAPASSKRPSAAAIAAGPRLTNLRPITARIEYIPVGSTLEADAIYLRQAKLHLPEIARIVCERWRAWWAAVDPEATHPEWSKTNLLGFVKTRSASTAAGPSSGPMSGTSSAVLLGPIPDKDAAGRFIEAMIDAFDLCRYPHLLQLAPSAQACAYKEMGRCPAPCDGSESISEYQRRTREAVELICSGQIGSHVQDARDRMAAAATAADFEHAQSLKLQADRFAALAKPAFAHVRKLQEWRMLLLLPSPVAKHIRPVLAQGGTMLRLADVELPMDAAAREDLAEDLCIAARPHLLPTPLTLTLDADRIDSLGILCRSLLMPQSKRTGAAVEIPPGAKVVCKSDVADALASLARAKAKPPTMDEQELEA